MTQPTTLQRRIPNALTVARIVMTVAFVAVLSVYRFPETNAWALPLAAALFVVAAITDALDGHLARRWNAITVFGRIADPLADKVLVLGAFVVLAGPAFVDPETGRAVSGVAPWMVVVILTRELLVTTARAMLESSGVDFSADLPGKLKMILQSAGAPLILIGCVLAARDAGGIDWATVNAVVAWAVTLVTAASAAPYSAKALEAIRAGAERADG